MRVQCARCTRPIESTSLGVFQTVSGLVENRAAGGPNTVALIERRPEWTCGECVDRLRHGISPEQTTLWDAR
jgi:hypothetical protein